MLNACIFASFRKYDFAEILRFHKLSLIWFHRLSQAFMQIRKYGPGFAVFSKLLQFMVSQSFARFCKENGLSKGFANAKIMVFRKVSQWALC